MIHAHIRVAAAERDRLSVVFQEEAELSEGWKHDIARRKRAYEALFETVIAEGQRQEIFRPGSVRLMVLALLGMCNWMHKWYQPEKFTVDEVAAEFALTVECGYKPAIRVKVLGHDSRASMTHLSQRNRRYPDPYGIGRA